MDVYNKQVIEYVTVAAETCLLLEHVNECTRNEFIVRSLRLLPWVPISISRLPVVRSWL